MEKESALSDIYRGGTVARNADCGKLPSRRIIIEATKDEQMRVPTTRALNQTQMSEKCADRD
jgi:hypothetical protein